MPTNDTGWKQPEIAQDSNGAPVGLIQPATGLEKQPCFTCRHWDKDTVKLTQFLTSHGLQPDAQGNYETPIVRDFKGRRSMKINPRDFGYCRSGSCPTHMNATCKDWSPTQTRSELLGKIR